MQAPIRVLLDRCARREAVTHRTTVVEQCIQWGTLNITLPVATRSRFAPRPDEAFKHDQLPYLASIPALVKAGRVELFSSFELMVEKMRNREPDRGYLGFDLFEGLQIKRVPSPVPRAFSITAAGSSGISEQEQEADLRSIADPRFELIRRHASDKHIADAFHYWTAERNGLDVFLTTDRTLINVYENSLRKKRGSKTSVLSPKQLCEQLCVGPSDIEMIAAQRSSFS